MVRGCVGTRITGRKRIETLMYPFTYFVKFRKGDSVVQMTVKALTQMGALEKLGITNSQVISIKVIDGI